MPPNPPPAPNPKMESKLIASLVSSLISQTLLLLLLLKLPFSPPLLPPLLSSSSSQSTTTTTTTTTTTLSLIPSNRKRKSQDQDQDQVIRIPQNLDHFKLLFHMSSSTFHFLSGLLDPLLHSPRLPGPTRLAIALSRLAGGASYPDIARRFSVPLPTARSATKLLCRTLCINFRFHLAFPSSAADLSPVSAAFRSLSRGLPGCCGALACARFRTGGGRAVSAQVVADAESRILSIAAGFRGERGDGEVLRRSSIYKECEEGKVLGANQYFVGGAGYPLLSWLVVPFDNVGRGTVEEDFNSAHGLMCGPAKRAVASLRSWGVMRRLEEEEDGRMVVACIATCAILHNILLMREDYSAISDELDEGLEDLEGFGEGEEEGVEDEDECFVEEKACVLRSTLAVKAREVRNS